MAALVVSDTSVLVDLERGGIQEQLFKMPFQVCVPDVLYQAELADNNGSQLTAAGLQVLTLNADGVELTQKYLARERRLSVPDAFALALAKSGGHELLTGDAALRDLASAENVVVHGVLWVFDQCEGLGLLTTPELHTALTAIAADKRCRLPRPEINSRLNRFASQ